MFSLSTAKDSLRLLIYRNKAKNSQSKYQKQILADGVLKQRLWSKKEWNKRYPKSVQALQRPLQATSTTSSNPSLGGLLREDAGAS